jgi:hypothetical protein
LFEPKITFDGAGASHALVARLDKLAARRGYELTYSVGWALAEREKTALRLVPERAWQAAIDGRSEVRERRADDACTDAGCAHRACWIEEAHVTELTGLLAIVMDRPSRTQAVPSPRTRRVWNGDQRSRSRRAGIVLRIGCCCIWAAVVIGTPSILDDSASGLAASRVLGR